MLNRKKEKEKKIIDTVGISFCYRYTILMYFFNVVKAYAVANSVLFIRFVGKK